MQLSRKTAEPADIVTIPRAALLTNYCTATEENSGSMLIQILQVISQLMIGIGGPAAAFWAVYNYRKKRRTDAARWVKQLYEQFYREAELIKGRELFEYDYEKELRYLFEIRVTDRDIELDDRLRERLRLADRVLNFFEQIVYLEDEGNFTERDRCVFFEYWFDLLGEPAKSGLHRYLARCGYEHMTKALGIHQDDYIVFYGTLMRSYGNLARIGADGMVEYVSDCMAPGVLVDLGDWPGAIRREGLFKAELWRVRDYRVFKLLDPFERYDARHPSTSYYERRTVRLPGPGSIDAWIYYLRDPKPEESKRVIETGDWEDYMQQRDGRSGTVRETRPDDATAICQLAAELKPLIQHTPYTYWVLCNYAHRRAFVAEKDGQLVGFVTSVLSDADPPVLLVWQLGVVPEARGTGLADRLLDRVAQAGRRSGATAIEATIEEDNPASRRAFERLASRLNSELTEVGKVQIPSAGKQSSIAEILYRIATAGIPGKLERSFQTAQTRLMRQTLK